MFWRIEGGARAQTGRSGEEAASGAACRTGKGRILDDRTAGAYNRFNSITGADRKYTLTYDEKGTYHGKRS